MEEDNSQSDNEAEKDKEPKRDLTKVFPEILPRSQCTIKPTVRKLKADEIDICRRLIKKYGQDNHGRMCRDIKLNYL